MPYFLSGGDKTGIGRGIHHFIIYYKINSFTSQTSDGFDRNAEGVARSVAV